MHEFCTHNIAFQIFEAYRISLSFMFWPIMQYFIFDSEEF